MAYNVNNSILTNQQAPADAKILVGDGQEYATLAKLTALSDTILRAGMKCTEVDTKTTYIWNGTAWVNESFGGYIKAYTVSGQIDINFAGTMNVDLNTPITFEAATFGDVESILWTFTDSTIPTSERTLVNNVQWETGTGSKAVNLRITNNFGQTINKTVQVFIMSGEGENMIYGVMDDGQAIIDYTEPTDVVNIYNASAKQEVAISGESPVTLNIPWASSYSSYGASISWVLVPSIHATYKTCKTFDAFPTKLYVTEEDATAQGSNQFMFKRGSVTLNTKTYTFYLLIPAKDGEGTSTGRAPVNMNIYTYDDIADIP